MQIFKGIMTIVDAFFLVAIWITAVGCRKTNEKVGFTFMIFVMICNMYLLWN